MKTLKLFARYIKKHFVLFIVTLLLVISLNYIRSIIPKLVGTFVAIINKKLVKDSEIPSFLLLFYKDSFSFQEQLFTTALIVALVALIREIINIICDVSVTKISEEVGCKILVDYLKKVQDLSYTYLNHASTGDLIQRSTQDVTRFKRFLTDTFLELLNSLCKVIVFALAMFLINVKFTLYVFTILPIYFLSSYFYFKMQSKDYEIMEEKEALMSNVLQENLTGIRVVKAFANEKYEINKFNQAIENYTSIWAKTTKRMSFFWGISDLLTYLQLLLVFVLSIVFVKNGELTFDQVTIMFLYTEQIVWPCRNLGRQLAEFGKTSICSQRILEILDMEDEYNKQENDKSKIQGNIEFKDVSFTFKDSSIPTLKNINLKINAGETVAIVGKTGSGKSTFVSMLTRLIDPTSGKIYLDGTDITKMDKKWVRNNIGMILQEPFLFSKTIGQNINITLKNSDLNMTKKLAHIASIDEDIAHFNKQYDTIVGERGTTLSGGQKQRIAIARILAKHHSVLIFDDSLSAVDTETDLKIRNSLKQYDKKVTTIIITHRITTASFADKIVVIENGMITNVGKHEELIKQDGLYKTIYEIQNYFNGQPSKEGK